MKPIGFHLLPLSLKLAAHPCIRSPLFKPLSLLVCLRHFQDPADLKQVLEWAKPLVQRLLVNNPDASVYQMHDPNQDRVKVPRVAYFRLKQTRLSDRYKQFLVENLSPGATTRHLYVPPAGDCF